MLIAEHYISSLINKYDRYPVSTDGGTWYPPQACKFLKLNIICILLLRKVSLLKIHWQYIKDRTKECFDDYFPCKIKRNAN